MNTDQWLRNATLRLQQANVTTSRLDALVLLEDATGKERSWLLAHPEHNLASDKVRDLETNLIRRLEHVPLAYIRGKSEFYGRTFAVSEHTLEPRPETETMVELLKQLVSKEQRAKSKDFCLADIGTGSGCIAITAKLEIPNAEVIATDISEKCLAIAQTNARSLDADITFYQGSLLEPLATEGWRLETGKLVVLANLPYVPIKYQLNKAAKFEPSHAIFGGEDGLNLYRELFGQLQNLVAKSQRPAYLFTEALPFQHTTLNDIAKSNGYKQIIVEDFIQIFERT